MGEPLGVLLGGGSHHQAVADFNMMYYLQQLSHYHHLFYAMVEMGEPNWDTDVETLSVLWNPSRNRVELAINADFFFNRNETERLFVLAHESLHVFFDHVAPGAETEAGMVEFLNIAQDIVINELLLSDFQFEKERLPHLAKMMCSVENIFSDEEIQQHQIHKKGSTNYYVELVKKLHPELQQDLGGLKTLGNHGGAVRAPQSSGVEGVPVPGSVGDGREETEFPETEGAADTEPGSDQEAQDSGQEAQDSGQEMKSGCVGEDFLEELPESILEGLVVRALSRLDKAEKASLSAGVSKMAGSSSNGTLFAIKEEDIPECDAWTSMVKRKVASLLKKGARSKDSFKEVSRRMSQVYDDGLFLPALVEEDVDKEDKYDLFFFLDTSGSCIHYKDDFFNLIQTIPTEKFNIHAFAFNTKVYDVDLKNPRVWGGGGTYFHIIEDRIQKAMGDPDGLNGKGKRKKGKYPDLVFVLTDGYGNTVNPAHPKVWHWLLTSGGHKGYISKESTTIALQTLQQKVSKPKRRF